MSYRIDKPKNKQRGRKIPNEQWDSFRVRILHLWLHDGEDGRTLEDVAQILKREHNFLVTSAQLHNRLVKKWNVRKYITQNEWRRLYWDEIDRQPAETIQVYFNNRLIPTGTKEREWDRYGFASETRPEDLVHLPGTFRYDIISTSLRTKQIAVASPIKNFNLEHPANSSGSHASSLSLSPTPVNTSIPLVNTTPFYNPTQGVSIIQAFSWATAIDWTTLSQAMSLDQQLVRSLPSDRSQLRSMSYSQQPTSLTTTMGPDVLFLRHIVSCIINNVKPSQHADLTEIYQWLANFPKAAAVKFFASFPAEILDIIRQRFRAHAGSDDNPKTVQDILELEYALNTSSSYSLHEISELLKCLLRHSSDFSTAQIIVRFASRVYADQGSILQTLLLFRKQAETSKYDWFRLMEILISAGAMPTSFYFAEVSETALKKLLEMSKTVILTWVERDLLIEILSIGTRLRVDIEMRLYWALETVSEAIYSKMDDCSWTDALHETISAAFSRAFSVSLQGKMYWTTEMLYSTFQRLHLTLDLSQYDRTQSDEILGFCRANEWLNACTAASEEILPEEILLEEISPKEISPKEISPEKSFAGLTEAIVNDDHHRIKRELGTTSDAADHKLYYEIAKALRLAISSGSDNVAAMLAARSSKVLLLLEHGKIRAVSRMLSQHSHWAGIMQDATWTGHYEQFEDVLYSTRMHKDCSVFPCQNETKSLASQKIRLQTLGYHAMYTRDSKLLDWLCERGLAVGAMTIAEEGDWTFSCPEQRRERLHDQSFIGNLGTRLPSLFDVAAQHNDLLLMDYFDSRTLPYRDSNALLHAVEANVHLDTINYLIEKAGIESTGIRTQYGSAALKVAIRARNYDVIRMLAKSTDIHGLETVDPGVPISDDYLDPLGEAILLDDSGAVNILLDNGGNPNALVAFEELSDRTPRVAEYSVLTRLTALLVAIDLGSLAMVKLLVRRGADVNRRLDMGLLRNPLQRAAEIGDFQMAELLIENNAIIDAEPAYGGGTALQLAAMSGHVGIATLLIERGANVNHPPARGPGRTAFEAAAEWCRPDMMYLLVHHGAQLDLEVTGDVEVYDYPSDDDILDDTDHEPEMRWHTVKESKSQYTRALEFAAERQEYASMNIVQSLYDKVTGGMWS